MQKESPLAKKIDEEGVMMKIFTIFMAVLALIAFGGVVNSNILGWKKLDVHETVQEKTIAKDLLLGTKRIDADLKMHNERIQMIENLDKDKLTMYLLSE